MANSNRYVRPNPRRDSRPPSKHVPAARPRPTPGARLANPFPHFPPQPVPPVAPTPFGRRVWDPKKYGGYKRLSRLARLARIGPLGLGLGVLDLWPTSAKKVDLAAYGWVQCCSVPGAPPPNAYKVQSAGPDSSNPVACQSGIALLCGTPLQTFNGDWPAAIPPITIGSGWRGQALHLGFKNGAGTRYTITETWHRIYRDAPYPAPAPVQPVFVPMPYQLPDPYPFAPPLQPMPLPVPRPVRGSRPRYYNPEDRDRGLKPNPSPNGRPLQALRPGRGTRERKVYAYNGVRRWLGWAVSQASEAGDLLDALHDALPDHLKAGSDATLKEKWDAVWKNYQQINMAEAIENMVRNQVTDPKYAEAFERMQKGLDQHGLELISLRL